MILKNLHRLAAIILLLTACALPAEHATETPSGDVTLVKRDFNPTLEGKWIGNGISYGAYRDGEGPDKGSLTSKENILEDLQLIEKRWNLIRLYSSDKQSQNILQVIRDNGLTDTRHVGGVDFRAPDPGTECCAG